jgi:hypothetical protein
MEDFAVGKVLGMMPDFMTCPRYLGRLVSLGACMGSNPEVPHGFPFLPYIVIEVLTFVFLRHTLDYQHV